MKKRIPYLTCISLFLGGCFTASFDQPPGIMLEEISLYAEKNANIDTALRVDLLVIYDKKLWDRLRTMPASEYFSNYEQLCRDYPSAFESWKWEIVPQQRSGPWSLEPVARNEAWGAILFANYQTPGAHRIIVGQISRLLNIKFGKNKIESHNKTANQMTSLYCHLQDKYRLPSES